MKVNPATRMSVRDRAEGCCEYCLLPESSVHERRFHVEHITATQHRPDHELANLAFSCPQCNRFKGPNLSSIDPETGELVRLFHPRRDDWQDHFHRVGAEIIGRTALGRATIALLRMNDERRIQFRINLMEGDGFETASESSE